MGFVFEFSGNPEIPVELRGSLTGPEGLLHKVRKSYIRTKIGEFSGTCFTI